MNLFNRSSLSIFALASTIAWAHGPQETPEALKLPSGNFVCNVASETRMRKQYMVVVNAEKTTAMVLMKMSMRDWTMDYTTALAQVSENGNSMSIDAREIAQVDWSSSENSPRCFKRIKDSLHMNLRQTADGIEGSLTSYPDFATNPARTNCSTPDLAIATPVDMICTVY
jgi:hypothetical protein